VGVIREPIDFRDGILPDAALLGIAPLRMNFFHHSSGVAVGNVPN